jgi:hypothetical protein
MIPGYGTKYNGADSLLRKQQFEFLGHHPDDI